MECLFCKIANHKLNCDIIYEDEQSMAFLDIHPKAECHVLLIPKKHFDTFFTLDEKTLFHLKEVAEIIVNQLLQQQNKKNVSLKFNYNSNQEISHVHMHILIGNKKTKKV